MPRLIRGAGLVLPAVLMAMSMSPTVPRARQARADEPTPPPPPGARLVVLDRSIEMDRGDGIYWQVDYRLKNPGPNPLVIDPKQVTATVDGWVSNSRVPGHAAPRRAALTASGSSGLSGVVDVVPASEEAQRCRERLTVQVWPIEAGQAPTLSAEKPAGRPGTSEAPPAITLAPGGILRVRLRLEHEHHLYGPFNALLGTRELELRLGPARLVDTLPLDRQRKLVRALPAWPPSPPEDLLDRTTFVSAPDSLHLEAHVPGHQSHRFPDFRRVRYGSRMKLSFWYLIAPGTDGECQARITQYRDLPNWWKTLHEGEVDERLTIVGRWVHVERTFRVEPEATSLALDFRILGTDVAAGELWIDDIRLEPIDDQPAGP
jgi:hypothetical protein